MTENNTNIQDISVLAKAMSNPIRIQILKFLAEQTSCFHGDMADTLPIAKSTLSQHLNELKDANLISGTISGNNVKYCINLEEWEKAQSIFNTFFKSIALKESCKK